MKLQLQKADYQTYRQLLRRIRNAETRAQLLESKRAMDRFLSEKGGPLVQNR